jgi:hypothetical protein
MRKLYFILLACILTGCEFRNIEIAGTAPGMDGATITIKSRGKVLFGENIQNGKFHVVQQLLNEPGYYALEVSQPGMFIGPSFKVYLEPGKYDISLSGKDPKKYPKIQSPSAIQNGLSAYYLLKDSLTGYAKSQYDLWLGKLNAPDANTLPQKVYDNVLNNVNLWRDSVDNTQLTIFKTLVKKQPNNPAIPHILNGLNITKNPLAFYKVFEEVSPGVRGTSEGKAIDKKLKDLISLSKGAKAPKLIGKTPEGKEIDIAALNKKAVIINFWRSSGSMGRDEHAAITQSLLAKLNANNIGIVSVCFDTDRDKWMESIKKRGMTWPQVNDLKGNDSPNITNWDISTLPLYYLLDGKGHIIEPDMDYKQLLFTLDEYLAKH